MKLLEDLTGEIAPLGDTTGHKKAVLLLDSGQGALGYSQFNELLLMMGYDRVSHAFFQYLVDGGTAYEPGTALLSLEHLQEGVERFRKLALVLFGNVKFAFKNLSRDVERLNDWLWRLGPREESEFSTRHDPVQPIEPIDGKDTYFLGYIVQADLKRRLEDNPEDAEALEADKKRRRIVEVGIRNHEAYLASDHLDVYVATSMRERHEYLMVHEVAEQIFRHERLKPLKLRWFDPTQAYCHDRIDKGLSEALMLKRAKCTVYFVQETDTLGKDSELASTLAQGKPVIAFVPQAGDSYADQLVTRLKNLYSDRSEQDILLGQLRIFEPQAAWQDTTVRDWLAKPADIDLTQLKARLASSISKHYDRRAKMLQEDHPLGIQVNLNTGVANGVLVVRSVEDCAELIWRVLTKNLAFRLDENKNNYVLLREEISDSIFRVMTGDAMLTNSFWNFYLRMRE
ncbi:MAG: hypothetical protein ACJ75H_20240 [Thermoanaerobaculia bacterium]